MARAGELGVDQALSLPAEVDAINLRRRARMVDLARELCDGSLAGMRVAVLGAAFKPNSDDIRDSPALDVALAVQRAGAAVRVYDPQAMDNARRGVPDAGLRAVGGRCCARRRRRAAPHRVGRVPRARSVRSVRGRQPPPDRGRPQCARSRSVARRRLDLSCAGALVTRMTILQALGLSCCRRLFEFSCCRR